MIYQLLTKYRIFLPAVFLSFILFYFFFHSNSLLLLLLFAVRSWIKIICLSVLMASKYPIDFTLNCAFNAIYNIYINIIFIFVEIYVSLSVESASLFFLIIISDFLN